ncbi:hypothetical protein P8R33_00395 [Qipengyuania sp. XHP0211]|uniref:lipopolysaccharide biosynthesis protein n=1 Tax=Qipengyuania sp. XHP0211 TaxID=3038079 RepID=UPI00241C3DC5|nr:hypothetical protein [Qipengyuania sp. XHP0211]MDG5749564.1 hypothetical protein [Qipengyuania sp. XHP0211]
MATNTAMLFMRQILTIVINLFTVRVLLNQLGVQDFAIYNVILGLVMLGSFFTLSMSTIIQRYFAFAMGKQSHFTLKKVHDAGLLLSIIAAALSLGLLATAGTWFVRTELVIAPERFESAQILFYLLSLAFALNTISTFHSSVILAHEDMHAFAWISIFDAILKLGAAVTLIFLPNGQLVTYGILLVVVALVLALNFFVYCLRKYEECRLAKLHFELPLMREMVAFGGWTMFGQLTTVSRTQAVTILINQAFSPATVAARAISTIVSTQLLAFARNFSSALHPPIIKAYASGEEERTFSLVFFGSKVTFYLVWMASLPLIAITPGALRIWLGTPPAEAVLFTQLALVENVIVAISLPLMTVVRATGKIRRYELTLGTVQALVLLFSWLAIRAGEPAYVVYVIAIGINLAMYGLRIWLANGLAKLPIGKYCREVLVPVIIVIAVSSVLVLLVLALVPQAAMLVLSPAAITAAGVILAITPLTVILFGISASERAIIKAAIKQKLSKIGGMQ